MDSDGPVGYFRIEMSDARPIFFPIRWMSESPCRSDWKSVRMDPVRASVR
jgi:hypothetical protein